MPPIVVPIGKFVLGTLGATLPSSVFWPVAGSVAFVQGVVGATVILAGVAALNYGIRKIGAIDVNFQEPDATRDLTVRSTVAAMKIVYGEAVVSGPVAFAGVAGTNNRDLWTVVALAGHEVSAITNVYFDDVKIVNADINGGAAGGGDVGGTGTYRKVWVGSTLTTIVKINKHLGTSTPTSMRRSLKSRTPGTGKESPMSRRVAPSSRSLSRLGTSREALKISARSSRGARSTTRDSTPAPALIRPMPPTLPTVRTRSCVAPTI